MAAANPPGPQPMMQMSKRLFSALSFMLFAYTAVIECVKRNQGACGDCTETLPRPSRTSR